MTKIPISFDMETSDPDDVFTLCWLAGHPNIDLLSVTVTPGTLEQIGIVRKVLELLDRKDILVGSKNPAHDKKCVSGFHYKWLGNIPPANPDGLGGDILEQAWNINNDLTIVCGASLGNISQFLDKNHELKRIVVQGGFAGDSVVPPEHRLEKFVGKETCPTFNLNGDVKAALRIIATDQIKRKLFVSKNVCHGFIYDQNMHDRLKMKSFSNSPMGRNMIVWGMEVYLKDHPQGKAFHDPLAACTAINEDICKFVEVEIYRQKGEWGSRLKSGTNTFISIYGDKFKFERTFE